MHIMEGFLPVGHALGWTAASAPFVVLGLRRLGRVTREHPEVKPLVGVAAAFAFAVSALKLPSVAGSSSHPTGTGLGAVTLGPLAMAPVAGAVLLFQALFLAHGGLTTLGANLFALGVAGPGAAWAAHRAARGAGLPGDGAVFLAAALGNLATYGVTAAQLALAFPDPAGGVAGSLGKFAGVFALTQVPLALAEGMFTAFLLRAVGRLGLGDGALLGPAPALEEARP